ncbi:DNA topoisomerase [Klebsiella pneumoniae]|nr:DNA topoisomerase [Klebsiella pneumoniae]
MYIKRREKGYDGVLNVGRVQSAVLGLVNMRTLANQNHTESFYYDVFASLSMNGHQIKAKYQTTDDDQIDEKKRLISEAQAAHIAGRVTGKDILLLSRRQSRKIASLRFRLTFPRFSSSAQSDLVILQKIRSM